MKMLKVILEPGLAVMEGNVLLKSAGTGRTPVTLEIQLST